MDSMIVTQVSVALEVNPNTPASPEQFREKSIALMDQLVCLEEQDELIIDVEMSGDYGKKEIMVEMIVITADAVEANIKAMTMIRTALHAAGEATPGWPDAKAIALALESAKVMTEKTSLANA